MNVTIGEYCDFFSTWFGLEDGSMLETIDSRGRVWVKMNEKTMTVEAFNELNDYVSDERLNAGIVKMVKL